MLLKLRFHHFQMKKRQTHWKQSYKLYLLGSCVTVLDAVQEYKKAGSFLSNEEWWAANIKNTGRIIQTHSSQRMIMTKMYYMLSSK